MDNLSVEYLENLVDKYRRINDNYINEYRSQFLFSGYIQDPKQSAEWNRKFVEEHNDKLRREILNKSNTLSKQKDAAINAILDYIQNRVGVSRTGADAIFSFAMVFCDEGSNFKFATNISSLIMLVEACLS